jgi:hypothetical protein
VESGATEQSGAALSAVMVAVWPATLAQGPREFALRAIAVAFID